MDEQRALQHPGETIDKSSTDTASAAAAPADVSYEEALLQHGIAMYMDIIKKGEAAPVARAPTTDLGKEKSMVDLAREDPA